MYMKKITVSDRINKVPASPIRKLVPYANEAKKQGVKVYHLNIGDPDVLTPEPMIRVLNNWQTNPIGYDLSQGNPELINALVSYYHGLGYGFITSNNIQITSGGSEAISMAMFAVSEPGGEIIVFEPFYANYNSYAVVNGVKLVSVTLSISNGFHLPDREIIEAKITPKTRAILICSPNNPTGTIYSRREMDMLVKICFDNGLFLLSDEVYREYCYDGLKQISLFNYMEKYADMTVVLDSMSKRYSLCGVRVGSLVTLNKEIASGVLKIAQGRLSSGLVDQMIASKLTEVTDEYLNSVNQEYSKRRDTLFDGLKKIPGIVIPKPEGAFYAIVKLPVTDAEDFCRYLLTDFRDNNETVMLAPAAGFYATKKKGLNEVRIAYVLNIDSIKRSIEIIEKALTEYTRR